jgi:hypothetical protein
VVACSIPASAPSQPSSLRSLGGVIRRLEGRPALAADYAHSGPAGCGLNLAGFRMATRSG